MARISRLVTGRYGGLMGNVGARVGALVSIFVATLLVANEGGPTLVGVYALLHVLPSFVGMVISGGLTGAVAFFVAGRYREDRRLPLTLVAMALLAGGAGAVLWGAAAPLVGPLLFPQLSVGLVALAGLAVATRLLVTTAKSCSQGSHDLAGANRVIFIEESAFLPAFGVLVVTGIDGYAAVVGSLLLADVATGFLAWGRLVRRGFFREAAPPSRLVARNVAAYGLRAQTGTVISQLNLRLDFVILSVLTSPAVLGIYAIASKFAELTKVLGMALTYVLYPQFSHAGRAKAAERARRLLPKALLVTAAAVVPLFLVAGVVIHAVYGSEFDAATTPARIILIGLVFEGVAAVITAFFYGSGRPGLYSLAMGAGLVVTVALDVLLIPRFEEVGAAVASAVAYTTSTIVLIWLFSSRSRAGSATDHGSAEPAESHGSTRGLAPVTAVRWRGGGVSAADRSG
jgi:O-antigen/teichoic acid export membrane protein